MMNISLNPQQIEALCSVIGDTSEGLTKGEIEHVLNNTGIKLVDDGKNAYSFGLSKKKWLFNCLAGEINTSKNTEKVCALIENVLNPVNFTNESKRGKYRYLLEGINKVLILNGFEVNQNGKIQKVAKATSLSEVDRRVNELNAKLYHRAIHDEVTKYCIKDYLRKDYYDAVFEASKGLAQRVREITGLTDDGGQLFQTAFAKNDPYLFFNTMKTDSEVSEFIGLKELLQSIFHLVRNPAAHTPKINWKTDETKALDVLTLISFAHKYLDCCYKVPNK
ncbi:MAG: TIGR02391 family protein [Eubacteriales bacterium]